MLEALRTAGVRGRGVLRTGNRTRTKTLSRLHLSLAALTLFQQVFELFPLFWCQDIQDIFAGLAKLRAQFRFQEIPINFGAFLAFVQNLINLLVLYGSQIQTPRQSLEHLDSNISRRRDGGGRAGLFHEQTTGKDAGSKDDQRRQNDFPGVHQADSASSFDARMVWSRSSDRLPEAWIWTEKDQMLKRSVTITQ